MPDPGSSARCPSSQPSRCCAVGSQTTASRRLSRSSGPRSTSTSPSAPLASCSATSRVTRALAVAVVASTGTPAGRSGQQGAQPAVVGPEVMAPVGDAVRLVHHQQPGGGGQLGQDEVAEPRVVQPLRADQQHIDRPGGDLGVDLVPLGRRWPSSPCGRAGRPGPPRRSGCASARAAGRRSRPAPRRGPGAARWPRSRPRDLPQPVRCTTSARRGRRPAPRSRSTGPRAAGPAPRPARAGSARPRRAGRLLPRPGGRLGQRGWQPCIPCYQYPPTSVRGVSVAEGQQRTILPAGGRDVSDHGGDRP